MVDGDERVCLTRLSTDPHSSCPGSSDELYAYLTACRPDLCVLEGREEDGEAEHDEEFVLIKDKDDEEEALQTHRSSGDDWEVSERTFPTAGPSWTRLLFLGRWC